MSTYVSVREFLPILEATIPQADAAMLQLSVVLTAIDFCKKTHFHQQSFPIDLQAGVADYRISVPGVVQLAGIRQVIDTLTGLPLVAKTPETMDAELPGWRNHQSTDPLYWHQTEPARLRLMPTPSEDKPGAVTVRAALAPSPKAKQIYSRLYDDYFNELVAGTVSRLCSMPKRDWSDRVTAAEQQVIYERGVRYAKADVIKGFSNESLFVQPQTFG